MAEISVIGAGSFGTALAYNLIENNHHISFYERDLDAVTLLNSTGYNPRYLPGVRLNIKRFSAFQNYRDALTNAGYVFIAVPTQELRRVVKEMKDDIPENAVVVVTSKGMILEDNRCMTISDIIESEEIPNALCGLYGITFAKFIAPQNKPKVSPGISSMTIASSEYAVADRVANLFINTKKKKFRIYCTEDLKGTEFGGAMKNVYAIAIGIIDGFLKNQEKLNDSNSFGLITSRYSLLNMCIMEFYAIGLELKIRYSTLIGPSGIGDIVAGAGTESRNYNYGYYIATNQPPSHISQPAPPNAEGFETLKAARLLVQEHNLDTPILNCTYDILFNNGNASVLIPQLIEHMSRKVDAQKRVNVDKLIS